MEQNVARSRTCGEVLCEVRFFFRVFSRVFLTHLFLHIREGSLVFSFLVCPPLLFSPLLFSSPLSYSLFSPPLLLPPLPFSSLLFLHPPLFHSGANTTTNTTTNIIRPLTPNLQPIKSLSALLTSHPINPPKNLNPTSIYLQRQ